MGSDPVPFYANPFFFFYESKWLKSMKNISYGVPRKFGYIFRFIGDLIAINDGNEFENHDNELPTRTNFEKGKHFKHRNYFFRPSPLYK